MIFVAGHEQLFHEVLGASFDSPQFFNNVSDARAASALQTIFRPRIEQYSFASAKETGGAYFPVTFEGEIPKVLSTINALLRSQYSLGFNPGEVRDGKEHKLKVSVDIDGDGTYDDKEYVIQARQAYISPKSDGGGDKK